jgi:hypothetical protein
MSFFWTCENLTRNRPKLTGSAAEEGGDGGEAEECAEEDEILRMT